MTPPRHQGTVLVVDDSDICLELAREALEAANYHVITAKSPLGVNRLLREHEPDVLVVDVSMPALRGDRLVTLVRQHQRVNIPILLHSDRPLDELRALVKSSGATTCVPKTPGCESLVKAVQRVTQRQAPPR